MHFKSECSREFLKIFEETRPKIRAATGCMGLELWREIGDEDSFTTLSHWSSMSHLESYRKSELFTTTWKKVKPMFRSQAIAISYEKKMADILLVSPSIE
jgi:quinol monooxygenase YgiN